MTTSRLEKTIAKAIENYNGLVLIYEARPCATNEKFLQKAHDKVDQLIAIAQDPRNTKVCAECQTTLFTRYDFARTRSGRRSDVCKACEHRNYMKQYQRDLRMTRKIRNPSVNYSGNRLSAMQQALFKKAAKSDLSIATSQMKYRLRKAKEKLDEMQLNSALKRVDIREGDIKRVRNTVLKLQERIQAFECIYKEQLAMIAEGKTPTEQMELAKNYPVLING